MLTPLLRGLFLLALCACVFPIPSSDREGRGTFYLTNPSRSNCQSDDGRQGYCLFQGCFMNNLQYRGRCGYGLGSCCLAQQTCLKTTNVNNTYFVNPSYPLATTSLGSCELIVKRRTPDICQIRLDFIEFQLEQPDKDGYCYNDAFSVKGASNPIPKICGSNSGQHMYIPVDPLNYEIPLVLSVDIKDITLVQRTWNIKVSQIECLSPSKAPEGCLQYFQGEKGLVQSFNFANETEGTRQLANMEYTICVKQELDYRSIAWSRNEEDGQFAFTLTGNVSSADEAELGTPNLASTSCEEDKDYILIPNGVNDLGERSERNCGLGFANNVTTSLTPFIIHARTGPSEEGDALNRGFSLAYSQLKI